jgi:hypothetical protein
MSEHFQTPNRKIAEKGKIGTLENRYMITYFPVLVQALQKVAGVK